jgi:hypothetical protein
MKNIHYRYFKNRFAVDRNWGNVHEDCREAIFNYLAYGYDPGGFLTAVLTNDLYRAAGISDFENKKRLAFVANFVAMNLPLACYGTAKKMRAWMELSNEDREKIMTEARLFPTLFDIIRDPNMESEPNF